ncbi:MAG: hypothetical protein IRZ08_03205 [Frankia sp.]|nr:hypothetical protein [Frankia sp.]
MARATRQADGMPLTGGFRHVWAAGPADAPGGAAERGEPAVAPLWLSEAVVGLLVMVVALVAWVSLALADLGAHSLPAVGAVSAAAVLLCLLPAALARIRRRRRARGGALRIRADPGGLALTAGIGVLAGVMFLPGFGYGAADKDPGVYVAHGMAIARTGDYAIPDPAADRTRVPRVELASPGARFPGVWTADDQRVVPQFYALWPAMLATAADLGGERALSEVAPVCGVLAVCALALTVRRAVAGALGGGARAPTGTSALDQPAPAGRLAGWAADVGAGLHAHARVAGLLAGAVTGTLLATNMLEVWQAKYQSSEISAQMFSAGALLGVVVALNTGSWPAAAAAGLLSGIGLLDRADGMLPLLLAAVAGAVLVTARRFDWRAAAFAAGVGVVLPHALWQAYSPAANHDYTLVNGLPELRTLAAGVGALFAAGLVVRGLARRHPRLIAPWTRGTQRRAGIAVLVLVLGLFVLGLLRERLFGPDYAVFSTQGRLRTYDEQSLTRLSWFLPWAAIALAFAGVAVVALRRWNAALWAVALPPLLLLGVYAWHTRNSVRLMWWARRYVPGVVPGLLALAGIAIGVLCVLLAVMAARDLRRVVPPLATVPAAIATGCLLVFSLPQSLPLRGHDELGGSFAVTAELAALAQGRDGVYLWPRRPCCLSETALFAGALWLGRGQLSVLLPADQGDWPDYIASFRRGFPDSPLFVIGDSPTPPRIAGTRLVPVRRIQATLPFWEESVTSRPNRATTVPVDITVWRVAGT